MLSWPPQFFRRISLLHCPTRHYPHPSLQITKATSIYFESLPYRVHPETGLIDFDELRKTALVFRPAMILCGASAYPRVVDFAKFREIADEVGAFLMADIAHISGLVATGEHPSPFPFCDV